MDDLIARLEAAEVGSRELDAEIAKSTFTKTLLPEDAKITLGLRDAWHESAVHKKGYCLGKLPHYTTSIDAALPWENIYAVRQGYDKRWTAIHGLEDGRSTIGYGNTEPLARRAAALKAAALDAKERKDG